MTGTPAFFDQQGPFFTYLKELPRPKVALATGDLPFRTVLVHEKGSDRVLIHVEHNYADGPFVCATLECGMRLPGTELPPIPFIALSETGKVDEDHAAGSGKRVAVYRIGDEKEISVMYRTLGDEATRYAWIHRSVLDAVLKERLASHGLRLAASLFLSK